MFYPALVYIGVTFAKATFSGNYFCWSSFPLAVIYDSGRYFEKFLSVSPGHVENDP